MDRSAGSHPKDVNFEFIIRGRGSDISTKFSQPIVIPTHAYEAKIGLKGFVAYNTIPNITENQNNKLRIKTPDNESYFDVSFDTGSYEIVSINSQLHQFIAEKYPKLKNVAEDFKLIGNDATGKAEFHFQRDGFGVDFDIQGSMHGLLGFKKKDKFENRGRFIAENIVDICPVTQLIFNTNVTESNYINGQETPFIYNTSIDVPPGYRMMREIHNISYKNLTINQISVIRVWITDQLGRPVNLRGDELLVTLSLKLERLVTNVRVEKH